MKCKKYYFKVLIILLLIPSLLIIYVSDVIKSREGYKDNLIRFHVIANSDSPADQFLKLRVRDRVIREMDRRFNTHNIHKAKDILKNNIDYIKYIAEKELNKYGCNYPVNVSLGNYNFPTKNYGSITLPAGNYQALRVVIGNGEGKNWWCVLFPPLCFIDVKHGITDKKTREELKRVLTEEEFDMINTAASNEGELPIKLKFKIVEIFERSKWKLSKLVGFNN